MAVIIFYESIILKTHTIIKTLNKPSNLAKLNKCRKEMSKAKEAFKGFANNGDGENQHRILNSRLCLTLPDEFPGKGREIKSGYIL